jgi:hypothetical protein
MSIDLNLFNYWQLCCIFNETNNDVQIFLWIGRNHNDFNIAENSYYHSWLATFLSPMLTCYFKNEVIPETHGVHYIKYRSTLSLLFQGHDTTVDYKGIIYPVINVSALIWLIGYIVCLRHYMFPLLPISLDCPFWLPLRYSLMFIYHGLEISSS